jgi:hypothetical protein
MAEPNKAGAVPLAFFWHHSSHGPEAIKDMPLARTRSELVSKRSRYLGLGVPLAWLGGVSIDLRSNCPMCNRATTSPCADCRNVANCDLVPAVPQSAAGPNIPPDGGIQ